ncbi:SDR family oxidoreductase [Paraburkholderia sp. MMS20-SJTN17]|uniref:SDR family oxidoreductase n=1 Tax=Paraburkholderia translucens TaxID=2886945 RepID=A0ABS8KCD3_9BURK|nr:SDR family oxidoreductase [Paraburkholderia sp. MMS20-SJTN17]MCC8402397.1 SDR family oxidoreductase [Paraburkholderia sp. MMS20-SJTN17]
MIAITGANGNLGRLVIKGLLQSIPASQTVAAVRSPEKADDLRTLGVQIREADYDRPETLIEAFKGVEKLLLISAVQPGERFRQHRAVIDAARQTGVKLIAYTSLLRAGTSNLILADEHNRTEAYLKTAGVNFVVLRNGWYLENHTSGLAGALANSAITGSAGQGRFASASRADYADAAVTVLTQPGHANQTYELAGDDAYSLAELAEEVSKQVGRTIVYNHLSAADYESALLGFGLPKMIADVVVDADLKASAGELNSTSRDLSRLLGRSTTTLAQAVTVALRG